MLKCSSTHNRWAWKSSLNMKRQECTTRSLVRLLTESYLTIFVLYFRLGGGQWPPSMHADEHKGVGGVTIVELVLILSLAAWVSAATGYHLVWVELEAVVVFLVLYFVNFYFLVVRGSGVAFEKHFNNFPSIKRIALRSAAIGIMVIIWGIFFIAAATYHQTFHIVPPSLK